MSAFLQRHWLTITCLILAVGILFVTPTIWFKCGSAKYRYNANSQSLSSVPYAPVGIIFGAGVYPDGQLSSYLQERVETGVRLYKAGRVSLLLMTGDNHASHYNEPDHMRAYALKLGVPDKAIVTDYAGLDTYDSCYRARAIFKVTRATLVTQGYHLPRALTLCRGLGINAIGVAAAHTSRDWGVLYILREYIASDKAVLELLLQPKPAILGPALPVQIMSEVR
jgi:vancomycin permeability regulator SanA